MISSAYYRNSVGAILVYDITKQDSFSLLERWIKEIRDFAPAQCRTILVGNKLDLAHLRTVSPEAAEQFAQQQNMEVVETSALKATNVSKMFHTLIEEIYTSVKKSEVSDMSVVMPSGVRSNSKVDPQTPKASSDCKC